MLKFLSKVKIEFNALDPRIASCMEFLAQCNATKAKESNPSCQILVKRRTDDHPPQITVNFTNRVEEVFDGTTVSAQTIRNMILEKGQLLETEQMFHEAGEKWPVIIPDGELHQPAPGTMLVDLMNEEDLAVKTNSGDTAFFYAVVFGYIEIAKTMLEKNPALATIRGREDMLPIRAAALDGHQLVVRLLHENAMNKLPVDDCSVDALLALIDCYVYDIAIQMVSDRPSLATEANNKGETALSAFARKPQISCEKFSDVFLKDYILPGRRYKLRIQGFELLKLVLQQLLSGVEEGNYMLIKKALFIAAKQGNWEFLTTLIHSYPGLAFEVDENCYTIFHIAVLYRHVNLFNLIHEIDSIENVIKLMKDDKGNNILHLAAKLPLNGLQVVPGAALQLQRELLWFEAVKKMVGPHQIEAKNGEGKTPTELFLTEHKGLREEGEKWMKDTANSCLVVSTLVAGVAFASSITLPGGNGGDTGIPNFLHHTWFRIFSISNTVSLIFSASSILLFLASFTSHYSIGDFKWSLSIKFIAGLFLLSCAVQAMIVAFVAAFSITFEQQLLSFVNFIGTMAAIPLILFLLFHFPLIFRVYTSTLAG